MNNVDKRVVEMQFDNAQFERGIQTSVKSLDNLKKGLDFENSAKSLEGLQESIKTFSVASIADGVEFLKDRFSTMGIIGMRALQNLTDAAMHTGKVMAQTLITDPMKTGFQEYETQQGAIQTILANTQSDMEKAGMSESQRLDKVNAKLAELNTYADKTIYNFTEMTRNIGTFTAAGVDVDVATSSIKGIANLAAVSGSNAQQASTAMYQLSQAISSGTVRLMDWNSVQNAGMGGEIFQKALMRTAKNIGVVGKEAKKAYAKLEKGKISYRDSLSSGWLSDDILTETLSQMSIDFESIADSQKITVEEAKKLKEIELMNRGYTKQDAQDIVKLAQLATDAATKVRTFTQLYGTLKESMQSGWTKTWQLIVGDFNEATELLTSIKDYFDGVIEASAESRNAIISDWAESGGRQLMIDSFWNIIKSIENVTTAAKTGFEEIFPPATGQTLKDMTQSITEFTAKLRAFTEDADKMGKIERIFKGIGAAIDIVKMAVEGAWKILTDFVSTDLAPVLNILDNLAIIGDSFVSLRNSLQGSDFGGLFAETGENIKKGVAPLEEVANSSAVNSIGSFLTGISDKIKQFLGLSDGLDATGLIIAALGAFLLYEVVKLARGIGRVKDAIVGGISDVFGGITDACNSFSSKKDISQPVLNFALALASLAQALSIVAAIDPERLIPSVIVLGGLLLGLVLVAKLLGKMHTMNAINLGVVSGGLILLGIAMTFFAKAVSILGTLDGPGLTRGIIGLGAVFLELAAFLAITKTVKPGVFKGVGFILLGVAMNLFAEAISKIGTLNSGEVVKGIIGLGAVFTELAVFLKITQKVNAGIFDGIGLILMAQAVSEFSKTIEKIGKLSVDEIVKGVSGLGLILLELIVFMKLSSKAKMNPNTGNELLAMALAINLFAFAMKTIGELSIGSIVKGVIGLGAVLIELAIFMKLSDKVQSNKFKSAGLISMAISMNLFATAIGTIGKLDTKSVVRGIVGMGAVLTELIIFMALTKNLKVGVFKSIGFILMAESMNRFADAVSKIGSLDSASVVKGIVGLGAIMTELAIFMALSKNTKLGVFKGAGLVLTALSMYMFAETVSKLGNLKTSAIVKGIIGLGAILTEVAIFSAIASKVKMGVLKGAGLVLMAVSLNLFASAIRKIGELETSQILKGVLGLGAIVLEIGLFTQMVANISLTAIAKSLLVMGVMVISLLAFALVVKTVEGVQPGSMIEFATSLGVALLSVTASLLLVSAIPTPIILGGIANLALIIASMVGVMALFGALESALHVTTYINKFGDIMEAMGSALGRAVGGFVKGMFDGVSDIGTELSALMTNLQPFLDGVKSIDASAVSGVKTLAEVVLAIAGAGIANAISSAIMGKSAVDSFVEDLTAIGEGVCAYAKAVSGITDTDKASMDTATNIAKGISNLANALPAQGGLKQLTDGSKDLGKFSKDIPLLGIALSIYAETVSSGFKKVNKKTMTNVATTAAGLSDLANNIPERGGLKQLKNGTRDLSTFSKDLPVLGSMLSAYAENVSSGFKKTSKQALTNAAMTAGGIAELANNIPESGGWKQRLEGAKDLGNFSEDIPALGESLKSYANSISGFKSINKKSIMNAADAAMGISTLANSLPESGGWKQKILGAKDLGNFSQDIPTLATGLKAYAEHISGFSEIDPDASTRAVYAMTGIASLANAIPESGGLAQRWSGVKDLGDFSADIPILATGLKTYAEHIKSFANVDAGDSAKAASAMRGIVSIAKVIPSSGGIAEAWSGVRDLGDFSADIPKLAAGLKAYATDITGFNVVSDDSSKAAESAMRGIAAIANAIPTSGGIAKAWTGIRDLGDFSEDIPKLGAGLKAYAAEISGFPSVKDESSKSAEAAAKGIVAITNAIPSKGGLSKAWTGWTDLGEFSSDIPRLGDGLRKYVNYIADFPIIDNNANSSAASAAQGIVSIAEAIPPSGGLKQLWEGAKDISSFAGDMPDVGRALKAYAESIKGFPAVTSDDISKASATASALKSFSETLPTSGGWLQAIAGQQNLGAFGDGVKLIGTGLAEYASSVSGINEIKTETANGVVDNMVTLAKGIADGSIQPYLLGELGSNISALGADVKAFGDSMQQTTLPANIDAITEFIINMKNVAKNMAGLKDVYDLSNYILFIGADVQTFFNNTADIDADRAESLGNFVKNLAYAANMATGITDTSLSNVQKLLNGFAKMKIPTMPEDGQAEAISYISEMVAGIQNGLSSLLDATQLLSNSGVSKVYSNYSKWFAAGKYLSQGLSRGISSMAGVVRDSAIGVASGAIRSIQLTWAVHSPSKVGEQLGMYFDLGIAGGFKEYSNIVNRNATDVGIGAVESAKSALSLFSSDIASGLDTAPTIRPVLDMTDVTNGVRSINGMFQETNAIRPGMFSGTVVTRNTAAMNNGSNKNTNGSDNREVVKAINDLTERFDNLSTAVADMQLVMDTGAVVGALGPRMDELLGVLKRRKERGN